MSTLCAAEMYYINILTTKYIILKARIVIKCQTFCALSTKYCVFSAKEFLSSMNQHFPILFN